MTKIFSGLQRGLSFWLLLGGIVFGPCLKASAVTRAQFMGPVGMIQILARDFSGALDSDGQTLYESMNVPPKNSMIGVGKTIESGDKGLQFICASRPQVGHECSIIIRQGSFGLVDPLRKIMLYRMTGESADALGRLFVLDGQRELHFRSMDGGFYVNIQPGLFEVGYDHSSQRELNARTLKKTLVVVNVQDTLKISHSLNFWDSLNYANNLRKRYLGMSAALQQLKNDSSNIEFIYLTENPELVAGRNEIEFVNKGRFPKGRFVTYPQAKSETTEALQILHQEIETEKPERVILMSHNGGLDPQVFQELSALHTDLQVLSYLHMVYSSSASSEKGRVLFPEQVGFVTGAELILDLQSKALLEYSGAVIQLQKLLPRILEEAPDSEARALESKYEFAFPAFLNCDDFQWRWSVAGDYEFLIPLRDHLRTRCHMQAPLAMIQSH